MAAANSPTSPPSPPRTPPPSDAPLFVRALHTFSPDSLPPDPAEAGTCLSFEQGQVIKCLNQDASGWWDGELEGRRGWFPSNYVQVIASDEADSELSPRRRRHTTHRRANDKHSSHPVELTPEANTLLSSIEQNVGLLDNAVQRASKGHYQPSTACLISSIRTVLSATQCLTRDSPVLRKHHSLSASRKHILSSLASLVNQARRASAPEDRGDAVEVEEAGEMLRMAQDTVGFVKGFLEEAERRGVEVNLSLGSSPKLADGAAVDENEPSIRAVKSSPSLQGRRPTLEHDRDPPVPVPAPALASPIRSEYPASLAPPRPSLSPIVLRSPAALTRHLSSLHDSLLSTIAALIGHIHSHSRTASPASSFAQLIDLTREGIERVRDILEVVEAVGGRSSDDGPDAAGAKGGTGDDQDELMKALSITRERLYLATTTLVTAARIATSPLASSETSSPASRERDDEEEGERKELLGAATGVLRAGGDCVGSVKLVGTRLLDGGEGFEIILAKARRPSEYDVDSEDDSSPTTSKFADAPPADPALGRIRNAHTLSMLGRKATSLSCLRQRFEREDALGEEQEEEDVGEDPEEDDHDHASGRTTGRRQFSPSHTFSSSSSSAPSTITPNPSNDGRADMSPSRASIPMSRNASSGSGSNTGSVISRTTASSVAGTYLTGETSPRSSYGTSSGIKFASGASSTGGAVPPLPSGHQRTRSSTRPMSGHKSLSSSGRPSIDRIRSESPTIQLNSAVSPTNSSPLSQMSSSFLSALPSPSSSTLASPHLGLDRKSSSPPASSWFLERDYQPQEISFNADGHVTGGTLHVLIERMTLHDTTIDPAFATTFLLTFRLFTSPAELVSHLYRRFDLSPPRHPETGDELSPEQMKQWTSVKLTPIRLRIYNLIKTWLETHWQHEADGGIVDGLKEWSNGRLKAAMPAASTRMLDLIEKRVTAADQEREGSLDLDPRPSNASQTSFASSGFSNGFNDSSTSLQLPVPQGIQKSLLRMASTDRLKAGKPIIPFSSLSPILTSAASSPNSSHPGSPRFDSYSPASPTAAQSPTPIVSKSLLAMLRSPHGRNASVVDVDPLELARQLTIMESRVYCSIRPEELLGSSSASSGAGKREGSVRKMSALSTRLTGWIAETILGETDQKRRTSLVKYFVKLGERLLMLNNYNALFAVFTALNSSTIARLRKTWDGLAPKYRQSLEILRRATDHSRNYAEYRGKIRQTVPPCLPFVGLFLTDLIFIFEGNRAERSSPIDPALRLINFDRYQKMSRIIGDLQRFQVPYTLVEVPEIQSLLATLLEGPLRHGQDAQSLYRQSLMIEPRSKAPSTKSASTTDGRSKSGGGGDVFNWRS
ncbi:hypothetical protein JCM11491_004143 [Sporobolomyces phaffii]